MEEEKKNGGKRGKRCKKFTSHSSCCCLSRDLINNLWWTFWLFWFQGMHNAQTVSPLTRSSWMWQLNMANEPWGAKAWYSLHGHNFIFCRGESIHLRAQKCAHKSDQISQSSPKEWWSTVLAWDQWISSWFQTFAMFCMLYIFFWVIPWRLNFICRRFWTLYLFHLHRQIGTYLPMKMEQTECSKTSTYKIQTPGNYPEENIQHWISSLWLFFFRCYNFNLWTFWPSQHMISTYCDPGCS